MVLVPFPSPVQAQPFFPPPLNLSYTIPVIFRRILTLCCHYSNPSPLQAITEDKYEVIQSVGDAAIIIKNTKEPPLSLTIHLTSPVVREELEKQLAGGTAGRARRPAPTPPGRCSSASAPPGQIQTKNSFTAPTPAVVYPG